MMAVCYLAGLVFNADTGVFSGTPPTGEDLTIQVIATDPYGLSASSNFELQITGVSDGLNLTVNNSANIRTGETLTANPTVTDVLTNVVSLDINAVLHEVGDTETLSIILENIPDNALLSNGQLNTDGHLDVDGGRAQ